MNVNCDSSSSDGGGDGNNPISGPLIDHQTKKQKKKTSIEDHYLH